MIRYHADWENGHTPVSVGRAPWLPAVFIQAMHLVADAKAEELSERIERQKRTHNAVVTAPRR